MVEQRELSWRLKTRDEGRLVSQFIVGATLASALIGMASFWVRHDNGYLSSRGNGDMVRQSLQN